MRAGGLYVHLPFCSKRCPYCDFNVWPLGEMAGQDAPARFHAALTAEIGWLLEALAREPGTGAPETLYFGGGTPSLTEPERIGQIVERVRGAGATLREITLEANPESFSPARFEAYLAAGVNRLSVGVQSLSDDVLRFLGREHDARGARRVLDWLSSAPLASWSADVLYGVAGQTLQSFAGELGEFLERRPPHVSLYALEVHPVTAFGGREREGGSLALDDDAQADLFDLARERLLEAGYRHYEISSFALPGHEAAHNSLYWKRAPVLAAGPGAWGFWEGGAVPFGMRWQVGRSLPAYLDWVAGLGDPSGGIGSLSRSRRGLQRSEQLDEEGALAESLFLGLRLLEEGVDLGALARQFGEAALAPKLAALERHEKAGWLTRRAGVLRLEGSKAFVAHAVLSDLVGEAAGLGGAGGGA